MPNMVQELKTAVRREILLVGREICRSAVNNFKHRLDVIIAQNGRHVEHLL